MFKKILLGMLTIVIITVSIVSSTFASNIDDISNFVIGDNIIIESSIQQQVLLNEEHYVDSEYVNNSIIIDNRTEEDLKLEEDKRTEAELYLEKKKRSRSLLWSKLLSYNPITTPEMQKKPHWCGPAAALNAIDTRAYHTTGRITTVTQDTLATEWYLCTSLSGTGLNATMWSRTLNTFITGNDYMLTTGNSVSNCRATLEANIIYSIDRNYPVIANVLMNPQNGFIHQNYSISYNSNPRNIGHYIAIIGYGYENGRVYFRYLDSADFSYGVFNVSGDILASVTQPLGIIW